MPVRPRTTWASRMVRPVAGGFAVSVEDLRVTAAVFVQVQGGAITGAAAASSTLGGAAGMAGDDAVLARWREPYDALAAVTWRAAGTATDTFGAIASRLVESGNVYLASDHASTIGPAGSPPRLEVPPPGPSIAAGPPPSTGPVGIAVPPELAAYWPGGDPGLLRTAGRAWDGLADGFDDAAAAADNAFRSLLGANSGDGFSAMATFWARHYENCGTAPLFNAVPTAARLLGWSCTGLADLIDDTRALVTSAAADAAEAMSAFDLPAQVASRFTRGATEVVLLAGKAALAGGYLDTYRDAYLRGLDDLVRALHSADLPHLEHLATPPPARPAVEVGLADVGDVVGLGLTGSAWDGVMGPHPTPDMVHISPSRVIHVLDGDSTGGGHVSGAGVPNKSEYPPSWSRDRIVSAALSIARDPARIEGPIGRKGRWKLHGVRDGVTIRVIVERDGSIVTAVPITGPGVIRNPREG